MLNAHNPNKTPVWITKDKKQIPITKMEDQHLWNTFKFMERKLVEVKAELRACEGCSFMGEMAQDAQASAEDDLHHVIEVVETWIAIFKSEMKRRDQRAHGTN